MKKKVLKLLFVIVCLLSSTSVSAYDFEVDGFYYEVISVSDGTCRVTHGDNRYTGDVVIPTTFNYDGRTWTIVEIGQSAFTSCASLTSVTIPNSITTIGTAAFCYCESLTNITIPNSVTTIESSAFSGCTSLTSMIIPNSVTKMGTAVFDNCKSLTSVTISNAVTVIDFCMFWRCSSLTDVTIPNTVTTVDSRVFFDCNSLANVVLGNSVKSIGESTFYGCDALTTLYSLNTTPPIVATDNFDYRDYMSINVYVPQEALTAYRTADVWKDFKNIQSIEGTGEKTMKCATPTIRYANNTLTFDCETENVTFESKITDTDIASYSSSEIQLGVIYNISVYATKTGYENSDKATATLCWIDAEPKTEGIDTDVALVRANAVLIQAADGQIDIIGLADGAKVAVYGIDSAQIGSAISRGGQASINANMTPGSIAIVKIGDRNIKVVVR